MTRDEAREHFRQSGLDLNTLTIEHLRDLRRRLAEHVKRSELFNKSFRMRRFCKIVRNADGWWCGLRCEAYYFDEREAVTINPNGFIGFAGWADDTNVQPILKAFVEWVDALRGAK